MVSFSPLNRSSFFFGGQLDLGQRLRPADPLEPFLRPGMFRWESSDSIVQAPTMQTTNAPSDQRVDVSSNTGTSQLFVYV